jgi:phosphatidylglycerophosphate synthase
VEKYIYNHFWNFLANNCLPSWIAPNALTLLGLAVPLVQIAVIVYLSVDFSGVLPNWVWGLGFFGLFWYQTIDAIDGKHARNTNNCSPLG